jgi:hypothetical protein
MYIRTGEMISGVSRDSEQRREYIAGIVTPIDLLSYITNTENEEKIKERQNASMRRI